MLWTVRPWGADGPPTYLKFVPETLLSLVDFKDERWTVRPWGADGTPANFKVITDTLFVSGGVEQITADGLPLGRGQSAPRPRTVRQSCNG